MGLGILPPASPRACATEQTLPNFKGSDLSILRTDMGMLTILQLVYGADEVLDAGAPAEEQPSSARDLTAVTALEAAMRARRAGRVPTARVLAAVRTARTSALRRACKALMLLWEVHALLKLTTYDDSTAAGREGHARAFEAKFAEFDQALRAMTSKSVDSLYFSEGKYAVGNLIRRWGRTVAFVNEQVQEHMVKVTKQLYSRCSDKSTQLKSWVRRLASGKVVTVDRKTTAPLRVLARHLDYIWGLCNSSDNRRAVTNLKQWGSKKWQEVEASGSHDLMAELVSVVEEAMAARAQASAGADV
mmetsp:Transcript_24562/g.58044  ORF Transcript_24562/g.58044 Transcript_24562/m.58044 type:complete len:303 (+) Transcript_24562:650-1558(+)